MIRLLRRVRFLVLALALAGCLTVASTARSGPGASVAHADGPSISSTTSRYAIAVTGSGFDHYYCMVFFGCGWAGDQVKVIAYDLWNGVVTTNYVTASSSIWSLGTFKTTLYTSTCGYETEVMAQDTYTGLWSNYNYVWPSC
jgi:uncharacterized protein YceK